MTFRTKLLLAMVLPVMGITAATLLIAENQVRFSYERHFQETFRFQVASFLHEREARLLPVRERVTAAAAGTRMLAAMENAGQDHPDQQDVDDLYRNGLDNLSGLLAALPTGATNGSRGLFFFLSQKGTLLYPDAQVRLPFSLDGLRRIAPEIEAVGAAVTARNDSELGYLAPEEEPGKPALQEFVFTPIVDQVRRQRLGVLGVGAPLPIPRDNPILGAIWLDGRLYSSSLPAEAMAALESALGPGLGSAEGPGKEFTLSFGGVPHRVLCRALTAGAGFPGAYQVCLYSLAEADREKQHLRRTVLLLGSVASLCALGLGWLISRGLAVPIQQLAAGAAEVERGNYSARVQVPGRDEFSQLGEAFNAMAERVRDSHVALEQKIAERTHELTERKRAEAALRRSETSLREAQRIAHLGNWEWDVAAGEVRCSDELRSILGLAASPAAVSYDAFLECVHPAERRKLDQALRESLASGGSCSLEHRVLRPDGEGRIVRGHAEVPHDPEGRAARLVGTLQDVTEQKRIEAEFLRAQRMDGIGAIAGGMAHDLNNALAPILMGIQLIHKKVAEPEIRQMLAVMESNTHRGAEMVRQVLTFARGREGERQRLDLGRLIREMEGILRQTMPKSITVRALVPTDLWPVLGNSTQLHQVLLNLCVNARDAMPKGGELTLAADNVDLSAEEARAIPEATPGAYVMVLVSDTGTGIPPELLPRIFEAFFTTKAPGKGTGLGLSTISRIVRNHAGFVTVQSEVGAGTTFELYLPRADAEAELPVGASCPVPAPGAGELLLFIDDDRSVREMVAPTLADHGYRVLTASDGAEGLSLAAKHEAELRLVLTDLAMPMVDGLELMEKLHARRPGLPVVLISGSFDPEKEPLPPGAAGFLTKPFLLEQLLAVISATLRGRPSPGFGRASQASSPPVPDRPGPPPDRSR